MLCGSPEVLPQRPRALAGTTPSFPGPKLKLFLRTYKHGAFMKEDLFIFVSVPLWRETRKNTPQTIAQSLLAWNRSGVLWSGWGGQKGWVTGAAGYTGTSGSLRLLRFKSWWMETARRWRPCSFISSACERYLEAEWLSALPDLGIKGKYSAGNALQEL